MSTESDLRRQDSLLMRALSLPGVIAAAKEEGHILVYVRSKTSAQVPLYMSGIRVVLREISDIKL